MDVEPFEAMDSETMRMVYGNRLSQEEHERARSARAPCPIMRRFDASPCAPCSPPENGGKILVMHETLFTLLHFHAVKQKRIARTAERERGKHVRAAAIKDSVP